MDPLFAALLDAAQRAPSAHNTQPWKLQKVSGGLEVHIAQDRLIPAIDPIHVEAFHALGALIENLLLTLGHLGFMGQYKVLRSDGFEKAVIYLSWEKTQKPFLEGDLYEQIPLRKTSRLPYLKEKIDEKTIVEMQRHIVGPCKIYWTLDSKQILSIRRNVAVATVEQLKDQKMAAELYAWTRFSSKDHRWYRDGLNAACMGWGGMEAAIYKRLLNPKILSRMSRAGFFDRFYYSESQAAPFSPTIVLLVLEGEDDPQNRILAGRSLQRLWLAASSQGLVTHPISAGVDVESTRKEIKGLLGVPSSDLHVNLFRMGKSLPCARSPRLTVDEIVMRNSEKR